ncbi:DUF11 domain-containing protein [Chryseobacterium chendengshani]|uniref:beta strand repeat-containing protein n=1 Tax=Chryseobacterium sp. LJ668 TaxID=2864040 RepID=UPI001C6928F9|nr:DUF11 domain-containing protein [Chryseobacterium sp. LJ668]MBW8522891.1 DUF11 domain-containing protein [Chryseobacterium sp. LJ668]QYK16421.1 DUF11 domain-containing protein [Chryseobacterium sp. LJ668]
MKKINILFYAKSLAFIFLFFSFSVVYAQDTDGDGTANSIDLDDDNDGILDAIECTASNTVTNPSFTVNAAGWTSNPSWIANAGNVSITDNNVTNVDISQSLSNLANTNSVIPLTVTIGAQDGSNAAGSTGSLQILLNNTLFATISNSTTRTVGVNNVTITLSNGATSTFTAFSTASVTGFTRQTFTLNIPNTGIPSTSTLVFRATIALDDWLLDDVSVPVFSCDTDGDTVFNHLDFDSDGDGCFDAIEGDENVLPSQLNANGSINTTATGGIGTTAGTNNGVPNLVNSGGSADIGGDIGQGFADSQNSTVNTQCIDTDSDGIPNNIDLDDDNDGISDSNEGFCISQGVYSFDSTATLAAASFGANGGTFNLVYNLTSGTAVTALGNSFTVPFTYSDLNNAVNAQNHIWNSFGTNSTSFLIIPGTTSLYTGLPATNTTNEDTTGASPATADGNFRFLLRSGAILQLGTFTTTIGNLPVVTGVSTYSSNTSLALFSGFNATSVGGSIFSDGYYAKMQLQNTANPVNTGNTLSLPVNYGSNYVWDYTAFTANAGTGANAVGRGLVTINQNTVTYCNHRDTDNDGTPDYLDLDSDGDGCFDALEGDENVLTAQLNPNGSISGAVDTQGVPVRVNTGGSADIGSDQGQGAGTSTNSLNQDAQCISAVGCTNTMYLSQTNILYSIGTATNPFTYTQIGSPAAVNYNAIGVNPLDGFIYGLIPNTTTLIRVNADGTTNTLGNVTGLPGGASTYITGEIDNLGNYYVKAGGLNNELYRINLSTLTATLITLSTSVNLSDFAYSVSTGLLYGVNTSNGQLVSINPNTGLVTGIGITPGGQNFGAMFASSTGEIYGANNVGGFYQFNIITGSRVLLSNAPASNVNDGAHCVTAPIAFGTDLSVTKTDGVTTYASGTVTTYTVTVSNSGPTGAQGATVSDPVPAGIPAANVSYTAAVSGGATTSVSGTQTGAINDVINIPIGGTVTYTVSVSIPFAYTGNLVNTATVTAPSNITDSNTANNTATDTDTQAVCYRPVVTTGTILNTNHGITSLNRAGSDAASGNWPMVRKGAWTVLESKTKGFVLNRLTTAQIAAIPAGNLVEGMMVYNITLDCLQVNTTGTPAGWSCFNNQTCPSN